MKRSSDSICDGDDQIVKKQKLHVSPKFEKTLESASELYKKCAEQGYSLARCYEKGEGCEKNLELAFEWYKKSAEQGHVDAQTCLADYYRSGKGCEKNLELAFQWYKESAEQGDSYAQFMLADCYSNGNGCEINLKLAFECYKKSAEQGDCLAQFYVAQCYEYGRGCEINVIEAMRWYKAKDNDEKFKKLYSTKATIIYGRIFDLEEDNKKLQNENASLKERIAELEITVPIEGGPEYQKAKQRFDEYKKIPRKLKSKQL